GSAWDGCPDFSDALSGTPLASARRDQRSRVRRSRNVVRLRTLSRARRRTRPTRTATRSRMADRESELSGSIAARLRMGDRGGVSEGVKESREVPDVAALSTDLRTWFRGLPGSAGRDVRGNGRVARAKPVGACRAES